MITNSDQNAFIPFEDFVEPALPREELLRGWLARILTLENRRKPEPFSRRA